MLKNSYKLWLAPCFLLILAIFIQLHLYLDWDVIWLMRESQTFIHGGHYVSDFFDPNPPMILYLYSPAALILSLTKLSLVAVTRIYTLLLTLISIWLCWLEIKRIFSTNAPLLPGLLLAGIALILFVLPVQELAQREHFLVILTLPYLFSLCIFVEKKLPPALGLRLIIGILAGLGFCIKPYFLVILVLLELFTFFCRPKLSTLFRAENSMIFLVILAYLASIVWYTPEYYQIMLVFVEHFYVGYATVSRFELILNVFILGFIATLIPVGYSLIKLPNKILISVLSLATLSACIVFFIAAEPWYYHLIPMFSFAILLVLLLLGNFFHYGMVLSAKSSAVMLSLCLIILTAYFQWIFVANQNALSWYQDKDYTPAQLIAYIKQHPKIHSLFSFSTHPGTSATVAEYTHIHNCSRFTGFWMMPNIAQQSLSNPTNPRLQNAVRTIRKMVTEDFKRCQPDLVVLDTQKNKAYFSAPFDYLAFFLHDAEFNKIWQNYQFHGKIPGFSLYLRKGTYAD